MIFKKKKSGKMPRSHMAIPWHNYIISPVDVDARDSLISEKASIIGRVGAIMLSCGTSTWRVRDSMATIAEHLGVTCVAEIGIVSINYTCIDERKSHTQAISLEGVNINTARLHKITDFVEDFERKHLGASISHMHDILDSIQKMKYSHSIWVLTAAAAFACGSLAFLLGAGIWEIICVFLAAAAGQFIRKIITDRGLSLFIIVGAAAAASCAVYAGTMKLAELLFSVPPHNGAGYICAVLFLVPGFPFITSMLDFAKLDMFSGLERLMYSIIVMSVATMCAWASALIFGLEPQGLTGLEVSLILQIILRLAASFAVVFGFSMMFNSTYRMAAVAGLAGMVSNVIRIELIELLRVPIVIAAFIGALIAGLAATPITKKTGYPRVSITIPSVIASVPGFVIYEAVYNIGTYNAGAGLVALVKAGAIIFAVGLGIIFARFISDPQFRHRD
jgi:uncharacterized membrane protein YjjP (DUF1212 family)